MRALPKNIRKGVNQKGKSIVSVKMENSEPVACIGAFVGKQLKLAANTAEKFAVYDLGGGTMDFVYGVFREAGEEDNVEQDAVIEILGLGGDSSIGGEKLIHKLAYKIYKDNREKIEENKIPFALPDGELKPDGFDGLIRENYGADDIADANVNILKEKIAGRLFKYSDDIDNNMQNVLGEIAPDASSAIVTLKNVDNEEVSDLELEVTGIDDFLEDKIKETVVNFAQEMDAAFTKEFGKDYRREDVHIFLAGNASKQRYVLETMQQEEFFNGADIQRIGKGTDEEENDDGLSAEYKINEKTAVAFGQLDLSKYYVDDSRIRINADLPPFQFHVGYRDSKNDEFVCVIAKNATSQDWVMANPIDTDNECTQLEYTGSSVEQRDSFKPLQHDIDDYDEDDGKSRLYLRINSEDTLEYRLGTKKKGHRMTRLLMKASLLSLNELEIKVLYYAYIRNGGNFGMDDSKVKQKEEFNKKLLDKEDVEQLIKDAVNTALEENFSMYFAKAAKLSLAEDLLYLRNAVDQLVAPLKTNVDDLKKTLEENHLRDVNELRIKQKQLDDKEAELYIAKEEATNLQNQLAMQETEMGRKKKKLKILSCKLMNLSKS